jgi:beta-phosphoglucomutase-like phosphatase (HAD superfamily)
VAVSTPTRARPGRQRRTPRLDRVAVQWQRSLDAAHDALVVADLPDGAVRARALVTERGETAADLDALAHAIGVDPAVPWLAPFSVTPQLLGLPHATRLCIFDLEGVLTDSGRLHAAVWAELFDDLLLRSSERTGWQFVPFDPVDDYRRYLEGRSRRDGIAAFLASRGIRLSVEAELALAQRKGDAVERRLQRHGVAARSGSRRYLEAAERAGVNCAVVAASANTYRMLVLARLAPLVDAIVDAAVVEAEHLAPRPAPDMLLAACGRLDVDPGEAVALTATAAGIAAARAAGIHAVGVGDDVDLLQALGAKRTAPTLAALLDRRLAGGSGAQATRECLP